MSYNLPPGVTESMIPGFDAPDPPEFDDADLHGYVVDHMLDDTIYESWDDEAQRDRWQVQVRIFNRQWMRHEYLLVFEDTEDDAIARAMVECEDEITEALGEQWALDRIDENY